MFGVTFTVVFSLYFSGSLGFLNFFNGDRVENFDKTNCGNKSDWNEIDFASIGVRDPNGGVSGILASEDSCATSNPIPLDIGDTVELYVYMNVTSQTSGLTVIVREEASEAPLVTFVYDSASINFKTGWSKIKIPIDIKARARVSIILITT